MQDLGRIVIDINEAGGGKAEGESGLADTAEGGAGEAASEATKQVGKMAMIAEVAGEAFTILSASLTIAVKAVKEVIKAIQWMHEQIMSTANDLRDYSPAIALAEMDNQLRMMSTKFRLGAAVGNDISGYMREIGTMERSMMEIKTYMSGIFSIILKPLLKIANSLLDWLVKQIPAITSALATIIDLMVSISSFTWKYLQYTPAGMLMSKAGLTPEKLWATASQVAADIRKIRFNTDPEPDYSAINEGFINDLRLMGAKI